MKHSNNLRFFWIVSIVSLLALSNLQYLNAGNEELTARIEELRKKVFDLEQQADQYRSVVLEKRGEVTTLAKEISLLNSQISALEYQIKASTINIEKTSLEIEEFNSNIYETEDRISVYQNNIGRLIRDMRDAEDTNLLTLVLRHANLSEFLNSVYGVETIQTKIIDQISQVRELKDELENQKSTAENKKGEYEDLKSQQNAQKSSLAGIQNQKDKIFKTTKGEENKYQALLNSVEKQRQEFFQEMQVLEAQARQSGDFIVHITADSVPPKSKIFRAPEDKYVVTQGYGYTTYSKRGAYGGAPHNGVDLSGGCGTSIRAIGDGLVIANGTNDGWGNWIAIKHENKLVSVYAHMQTFAIRAVGDQIKTGTVIGYEGTTGNSTGCHVHLSLYRDFFTYKNDKKNGQLYFNYFDGSLNPLNYI